MTDRLMRVHASEGREVAAVMVEQVLAGHPVNRHALELGIQSAYSVGLELGLHIAQVDPSAASRIRSWFRRVVQENDPLAYEAVDQQARTWIDGARTVA